MKIGCQGTIGSFSQIAASKLFEGEEFYNYLTFNDVVVNVLNENLDYGVLPIENSYTGEVAMVLDELYKSNVFVVGVCN